MTVNKAHLINLIMRDDVATVRHTHNGTSFTVTTHNGEEYRGNYYVVQRYLELHAGNPSSTEIANQIVDKAVNRFGNVDSMLRIQMAAAFEEHLIKLTELFSPDILKIRVTP